MRDDPYSRFDQTYGGLIVANSAGPRLKSFESLASTVLTRSIFILACRAFCRAEQTVDGGLVPTESGGDLRERHVRAVFSQGKQKADGLFERFAGSRTSGFPGERVFTTVWPGGQAGHRSAGGGELLQGVLTSRSSSCSHCENVFQNVKQQDLD
jgi:hypothetical protein